MLDFNVFRSADMTWPETVPVLRRAVREFLEEEKARGSFQPRADAWLASHDPSFSRRLAEKGWVGMTLPAEYGGHARSALERYVVVEELLAAGAPVAAHWVAERQAAPAILRTGTDEQKWRYVPDIIRGALSFSIGLSEPGAGSDLAAVRTQAMKVDGGWRINGNKIWASHAHRNDFLLTLCRTAPRSEDRHAGLSQFIVDLRAGGVTVRAIESMGGDRHFCEVHFEDVFVADEQLLGVPGDGWRQVTAELTNERTGPERFLSSFVLLRALWDQDADARRRPELIGAIARLWALRQMSRSLSWQMELGRSPQVEAALVKDEGTTFETELIDLCRRGAGGQGLEGEMFVHAVLGSPAYTIRGGTNEVLRGIVAKALTAR